MNSDLAFTTLFLLILVASKVIRASGARTSPGTLMGTGRGESMHTPRAFHAGALS